MSGCLTDSDCVGADTKPGKRDGCGITGHCGCTFDCGSEFGPRTFGCGDAVGVVPSSVLVSIPPIAGAGASHHASKPCEVSDCDNSYCGGSFILHNGVADSPTGECGYGSIDIVDECPNPTAHVRSKFMEYAAASGSGPVTVPICDPCAGVLAGGYVGGGTPSVPTPPAQFPNVTPGLPVDDPLETRSKLYAVNIRPKAQSATSTAGRCWEITATWDSLVRRDETGSVPCGMIHPLFFGSGAFINEVGQGAGAAGSNCDVSDCATCDGTLREPHDITDCPCSIGVGMRNGDPNGAGGCTCCGCDQPVDTSANIGCCDANPGFEFTWVGKKEDTSTDSACPFGTYTFDMMVGNTPGTPNPNLPNYPFINTGELFTTSGSGCGLGTAYTAVPPACTNTGDWTTLTVNVE